MRRRVFRSEEVRDAADAKDPLLRAAALSYFPGRSGDLIIATRPGWMISAAGTTHGSATPDDQRVPLLFLGRGVKPGRCEEPATPADLAPTTRASRAHPGSRTRSVPSAAARARSPSRACST